jgi:hypothetical protein
MQVRHKSFMTFEKRDHPDTVRGEAAYFANKVLMDHQDNRLINITESLNKWGSVVTVWYNSVEEIR